MESVNEFYKVFRDEWIKESEDTDEFVSEEEAFTKVCCNRLCEVGILENPIVTNFSTKKTKISAYEIRETGTRWQLDIVVAYFNPDSEEIQSSDKNQLKNVFNLAAEVLKLAQSKKLKEVVSETNKETFELVLELESKWEKLELVNIYLITNQKFDQKIKSKQASLDQLEINYAAYGVEQFYEMHEKLESANPDVTFTKPLPCLPFSDAQEEYETILAVFPGEELAKIYRTWGTRLLENNVRAFLQVKGSVNKSIRETLTDHPSMFLAYNNGLTITATDFVVENGLLTHIEDMQIVNGGQTTASLYHYRVDSGKELEKVFVSAKIIKIPKDLKYYDVVKKISFSSNNQNKINAADLDANSPFHKKFGELSKMINPPGKINEGKWYYEQLRGGYLTDRSINKTSKEKKKFDLEYPRTQKIEKAELAKYYYAWGGTPHIVSLGAQKCFNHFRLNLAGTLDDQSINDIFYKQQIAKAIIFRTTEKLAKKNKLTPYTANIVAYGISLFSLQNKSEEILSLVWNKQELPLEKQNKILECMLKVKEYFHTKAGVNISELAKKESCWDEIKKNLLDLPLLTAEKLTEYLDRIGIEYTDHRKKDGCLWVSDRKLESELENLKKAGIIFQFSLNKAAWWFKY
jgi:hypothetical protein